MAASIFDQGPDLRTIRANTATLNEIVSSVLSLRAQSQLDQAKATAAEAQAQGSQAEAGAYTTSATIAEQNAFLAEASGKIQQYQQLRSAFQTIGAQKAAVAAAGFASSARRSIYCGRAHSKLICKTRYSGSMPPRRKAAISGRPRPVGRKRRRRPRRPLRNWPSRSK